MALPTQATLGQFDLVAAGWVTAFYQATRPEHTARLGWQMIRALGYEQTAIEQEAERMEARFATWHR